MLSDDLSVISTLTPMIVEQGRCYWWTKVRAVSLNCVPTIERCSIVVKRLSISFIGWDPFVAFICKWSGRHLIILLRNKFHPVRCFLFVICIRHHGSVEVRLQMLWAFH